MYFLTRTIWELCANLMPITGNNIGYIFYNKQSLHHGTAIESELAWAAQCHPALWSVQ